MNTGYGLISPRNCFVGGQSTNCRVNALILEAAKQGLRIEILFCETKRRFELEAQILRQLRPEWNKSASLVQDLGEVTENPSPTNKWESRQVRSEAARKDQPGRVDRAEAARVLKELRICKSFNPKGEINGPNCQRFGHQAESGRWWWDVAELIGIAEEKSSANAAEIKIVADRYDVLVPSRSAIGEPKQRPGTTPATPQKASRAELQKGFIDAVCKLESVIRDHLPYGQRTGPDRRTLGQLIYEAKEMQVFEKAAMVEASFVNVVRNSVVHPGSGGVSDDGLIRATASARALATELEKRPRP
jgi:hypothetical protein